ncbi:Capsular glucan synthase [Brevundimonas sp. SH203]|uniref:glycosyltransferase family 4 protein n=1 Tax=Brevundimonas sp. SH203 TaxID=345167 RepID=UPI0009D0A7CF|nr:glycosyltransferase family 1 protein [Brevundimonas sp. SH203]GAW40329.1 Capsular glucan synthase [Brevundimonas sp. SH203]
MDEPILINGRFLTQPLSGVQRYAREIVRALDRLPNADRRYRLMVPNGADPLPLDRIPVYRLPGVVGHLWEQVRLAEAARDHRLLSLCGAGPVGHSRQVVVIHDAAVFRRPDLFKPRYVLAHRVLDRRLARRARLATVSRFSRAELAAVLNLSPDAIAVAPNSADHLRDIVPDTDVLRALNLPGRRYFVCIGNQTPNKNLAVAARALARLPDPDIRLVRVGARLTGVAHASTAPDDPRIVRAGRRTDREIAALLRGATGLIFPSLYEGFGIPPLEAMVHGCPVIASDIPATREVCADAAFYFDPTDDAALAEHMQTLLNTPALARLEAGRRRADAYSWSRSAAVLDALLDSSWS